MMSAAGSSTHNASPRIADWLWFFGCALTSSVWCVTAARQLSATFDEPLYIARGLECWRTGTHSSLMKLGTMPLPVDLFTLPLYVWERWHGVRLDPVSDFQHLLPWARAGTLVFWWVLLGYGWLAGRSLAGRWGGRLAVAFLACEPTLLAHAGLATTDIAVSACLLALVYHFRTAREAGWLRRVGVPTLWFAATVLAKASGLVFGPLCLFAVEIDRRMHSGAVTDRLRPFRRDVAQVIGFGLVAVFVYCGSDWQREASFVAWAHALPDGVLGRGMVWVAEHLRIFSNAGEGVARQIKHNLRAEGGHWAYLLGEVRRAFWYYFPLALTIKLSLPLLAMPVVLAALRPRLLVNWANLAAAALLISSLTMRVQIGVRLVLPLISLAVVGMAAAAVQACSEYAPGWRRQTLTAALGIGVVWTAVAAASVWPHGLCYTNELWGGTPHGYLYLSDSNYDWGQGLKELASWQRQHGPVPLDVWYFGTDPLVETLPMRTMPLHVLPMNGSSDIIAQVHGHYLAASVTFLYGAAVTDAHRQAAAFLRTRRPIDRTVTFFLYDFTHGDGSEQ